MKFIALASALAANFVIGAASGSNVRSPHSRALRAVTHLNICPRTGLDLFYRIWIFFYLATPESRIAFGPRRRPQHGPVRGAGRLALRSGLLKGSDPVYVSKSRFLH